MNIIDAHAHVWTPDTVHYPLAKSYKKEDMNPPSFTAEELLKHAKPAGVQRVNLIQMSFYGFDNRYMLDMIGAHKGIFVGTAVIDPNGEAPDRLMTDMAKQGVRAFRILPRLTGAPAAKWLQSSGYEKMFAQAAKNNQAISCLIDPDCLPEVDRMCRKYPSTPVIIDHLARVGVSGTINDEDVKALCDLAKHKRVMVKVGAFYALGRKKPPYDDLAGLIEKVVKTYGPDRCMWESDSPFQVMGEHSYKASVELVRTRLKFLSDADREWLLRKTAEAFFFPA